MNDFLTPSNAPQDNAPSTEVEANSTPPATGAEYRPDADPKPEPMSLDDAVKKAAEETKSQAEDDGKDNNKEKPAKEAKPAKAEKAPVERGEGGKFKAKEPVQDDNAQAQAEQNHEASGDDGGEDGQDGGKRPSEGRNIDEPPARFLPRAKEKWASVDPDVKGEVHRAIETMERGMEEYREDREFRKGLRDFETMAQQAGTNIRAALENYVRIDQELRTNPTGALEQIFKSIGITPQQYAAHILGQEQQRTQNPQAYAQNQQTQALQQQIAGLQQQIQQLTQGTMQEREAARIAAVERDVIGPFAAENPRYKELEADIAFFLNSGKVPSNLPERQRLEVAYDMAERINPAPSYAQNERVSPAPNAQRPLNPAGSKSVRGNPSPGASAPKRNAALSLDESIKAAMAQNGLA